MCRQTPRQLHGCSFGALYLGKLTPYTPVSSYSRVLPTNNNKLHSLKIIHSTCQVAPGPKRKQTSSNHPFSGAFAVSFREGIGLWNIFTLTPKMLPWKLTCCACCLYTVPQNWIKCVFFFGKVFQTKGANMNNYAESEYVSKMRGFPKNPVKQFQFI